VKARRVSIFPFNLIDTEDGNIERQIWTVAEEMSLAEMRALLNSVSAFDAPPMTKGHEIPSLDKMLLFERVCK
jgi:hypothetical protein